MNSHQAPARVIETIRSRIAENENGCWIWPGATASGYGRIAWSLGNRKMVYRMVHRVMYEAEVGPIPEGLDLDHMCHEPATCTVPASECPHRACCNPAHLLPSTRQANLLRGGTVVAERAATTHCPAGHEYDEANTSIDKLGRRCCRECVRERNRAYYWRNRERRAEYNRAWREARKS